MLGGLRKALLIELEQPKDGPVRPKVPGKVTKVQFNPETLKVSYSNSVKEPKSVGSQGDGTASRQFVGAGTTKLSLELWFDVTVLSGPEKIDDVRRLTGDVTYFMVPLQLQWSLLFGGGQGLSYREANADALQALRDASVDFYAAMRSAYLMQREADVREARASSPVLGRGDRDVAAAPTEP